MTPLWSWRRWAVGILIGCCVAIVAINPMSSSSALCTAYQNIIHALARPGFVPNDICFFKRMGSDAHYSVGNLKFSVPREYFWLGGTKDDGQVDAIYLMLHVPEMTPASTYGDQAGNVAVRVRLCEQEIECISDRTFAERGKERKCSDPSGAMVSWPPAFKRITFRSDDFYYRGSICEPDELMICAGDGNVLENPRCEYKYRLAKNIYVEIGFRKRDVFGQTHLVDGVKKKILGFVFEGNVTKSMEWGKHE